MAAALKRARIESSNGYLVRVQPDVRKGWEASPAPGIKRQISQPTRNLTVSACDGGRLGVESRPAKWVPNVWFCTPDETLSRTADGAGDWRGGAGRAWDE